MKLKLLNLLAMFGALVTIVSRALLHQRRSVRR